MPVITFLPRQNGLKLEKAGHKPVAVDPKTFEFEPRPDEGLLMHFTDNKGTARTWCNIHFERELYMLIDGHFAIIRIPQQYLL